MKPEQLKEAIFDMFRKPKEAPKQQFRNIDSMLGGKMNLTANDFAQLDPNSDSYKLKAAFEDAYLRGNTDSRASLKTLLDTAPYNEMKDMVDLIDTAKGNANTNPNRQFGASNQPTVRRSGGNLFEEKLRMQMLAGVITESEYKAKISETYQSNIDVYKEEFKKRGFKMIDEEYFNGGHDDIWYKEFPLGRFCVSITTWDLTAYNRIPKHDRYQYHIFFEPTPKFEKKLFGLLKTKKHQYGKMIDFEEGTIDFGEGLFKIEDKDFIPGFFNKIDTAEKVASKITDVEYLSHEDSKNYYRPAFPDVNE